MGLTKNARLKVTKCYKNDITLSVNLDTTGIYMSTYSFIAMQFEKYSYFSRHFNSCYLKFLPTQRKFSGTRKLTFKMNVEFETSRAELIQIIMWQIMSAYVNSK